MQVIAAPALIQGQRTGGVSGRLTAPAALAVLLRGTGLHPVESNGVLVLRRAPPRPGLRTVSAPAPVATPAVAGGVAGGVSTLAAEPVAVADDIVVNGYRRSLLAAQELTAEVFRDHHDEEGPARRDRLLGLGLAADHAHEVEIAGVA